MKRIKNLSWLGFGVASLLLLLSCSKSTSPNSSSAFPGPQNRVATDITLSIYSDGWGNLLETRKLASEGAVAISVNESNPYYDPPRYYVYARAANFYTELYGCQKGETIVIDLDGVPPCWNVITGVIFGLQTFVADRYYGGETVEITGPNGTSETITTDDQGRYGLALVPEGAYTLSFTQQRMNFWFEITNSGGTDFEELSFYEPYQVESPNIYLYPEAETNVSVKLSFPAGGRLTESEPPYGNGWQVHVSPEGIIEGGYDYLFYEALLSMPLDHESGWLLSGHDLEGELRGLLEGLGFVGREIDDFVDYWVPLLEGAPWYAVYPQEPESMITLDIWPAPKSILRALFVIRALEHPVSIPAPPVTEPFTRDGFTAVEWGVVGWSD